MAKFRCDRPRGLGDVAVSKKKHLRRNISPARPELIVPGGLIRGDMIESYKIITGIYDKEASPVLKLNLSTITRGNRYKLETHIEQSMI